MAEGKDRNPEETQKCAVAETREGKKANRE